MTTLYDKSNQDNKNEDDVYICTLSGNRITSVTIRDKEGSEACIRQMRATHRHVHTFRKRNQYLAFLAKMDAALRKDLAMERQAILEVETLAAHSGERKP